MNLPDNFCIMPWLNMHLEADGRVRPCGSIDYGPCADNLHLSPLESLMNSDHMKNLRRTFLKGDRPDPCWQCYRIEGLGQKSNRLCSNEKHKNVIEDRVKPTLEDGTISDTSILSLGVHLSNLCNFKCRTCRAESSTSWYAEADMLPNSKYYTEVLRPTKTKEDFWNLIDRNLPTLQEIYMLGGEPLIEPDHYILLDKLIAQNRTDIELKYSTNLSHLSLGNKHALEYWKKFKSVTLFLSYDGTEKQGEFIRKGMNWKKTMENHQLLQQSKTPNINYVITPTISVLNVFHVVELIRFLLEEKLIERGEQVGLNILNVPTFYRINILNQKERDVLKKLYDDFIENVLSKFSIPNKDVIINQLYKILERVDAGCENTELERRMFVIYNAQLNQFRNENLLQLFPELADFYFDAFSKIT